jgi:hypothetical protein
MAPDRAAAIREAPMNVDARPSLLRALGAEPRWLSGMSWQRVLWLFGIALGMAMISALSDFVYGVTLEKTRLPDPVLRLLEWFVRYLVCLAPVLVALTVADNLPLRGAWRVAALAAAIVIGAQAQWPILCTLQPAMEGACGAFGSSPWRSWSEMLGANTFSTIILATPLALVYFYRRRDVRIERALRTAEAERAETQRRTLEAQLQAMQARVEPGFLFETLGEVGELFDREPEQGERMLDELIRYLRAALPDMRAPHSTLRREADLARAYLGILRVRACERLAFEVRVPPALDNVSIAPMLLLPLLAAALGATGTSSVGTTSLAIDARAEDERLMVAVTGRGEALRAIGDTPVVREVRDRLRALHGERASLWIDEEAEERITIVLGIPHAPA